MNTTNLFFVYGTLKSGYGNNVVLGDAEFVGEATTIDEFYLVDCGFPYMIPAEGEDSPSMVPESHGERRTAPVRGEVYHIPSEEDRLSADELEGVRYGHYKHKEIPVRFENGAVWVVTAYIPCEPEMCMQFPSCGIKNGALEWPAIR